MDKELFVDEISAHGDMLYRVAWSILRNDEACKDALQETALKAWEKRHTLRELSRFRAWITRILVNACYDMLRKKRPLVSIEDVPEPSAPPPDPMLALAIEALPEKQRLPIILFYSEGMSYSEIADALKLPVPTVRSRLHTGREMLRKELAE